MVASFLNNCYQPTPIQSITSSQFFEETLFNFLSPLEKKIGKDFKKPLVPEEVEDHLLNKISVSPDMPSTFNRSWKLSGLGK